MTKEIANIILFPKSDPNPDPGKHPKECSTDNPNPSKWVGRIAIFELSTGSRVQGKILAMDGVWLDTDNGAIRINDIVHAKWVSEEEERIIRGGPLGSYNNQYTLPRR